jgi:threonine dehydrogenase-like Zn-dependent dehydrogenase
MRRIVAANRKAWLEEEPDLRPEGEWVVVQVAALPICGSDRHVFQGEQPNRHGGHEGVGVVVAAERGTRVREDDRVALMPASGCGRCSLCLRGDYIYCRSKPPKAGHFAEQVLTQDWLCLPLPDDLSFEQGSLVGCALCPGFGALRRMGASGADTVMVTGLGPVGMGAVVAARHLGARVVGIDPEPWRRARALALGAEAAFAGDEADLAERLQALTSGAGFPCALDCSGHPDGERLCVNSAAVLGKVAFVGENFRGVELQPSQQFIRKGLTLFGQWHFNLADYPLVYEMIRRTPGVEQLISHRFPFDEVQTAFETFFSREAAKVLLVGTT